MNALVNIERRWPLWLLFALVFCTASFYRDFAHVGVNVSGTTLFVTEVGLALIVTLLGIEFIHRRRIEIQYSTIGIIVAVFISWGVVCLLRGSGPMLHRLRDFAANYYSLFFLLVAILCRSFSRVKGVARAIALGTVVAAGVVALRVATSTASVTSTGVPRYHSALGIGGSFVLFALLGMPARTARRALVHVALAAACIFGIIVATQHRSAALALAVAGVAWLLMFHQGRAPRSIGSPGRMFLVGALALAGIAALGALGTATFARLLGASPATGDYNALWRLYLWKQLFDGFLAAPIFGHGFGPNLPLFMFRSLLYGDDPVVGVGAHNSYLFVMYKEGLIGIGLILLYGATFLVRFRRGLRSATSIEGRWLASAFGASFVFVATYAGFNVVLEGPYMGMFFWMYPALAEAALITSMTEQNSKT